MNTNPYFLPNSNDPSQNNIDTANATTFPALPDDFTGQGIDLNEQLIRNKPATFFMRVHSDAMIEAGIHNGDVVIVDRSLPAANGKIIIAVVDGELLIRRLEVVNKRTRLVPASRKLSPIDIGQVPLEVWGVVTYVIHGV